MRRKKLGSQPRRWLLQGAHVPGQGLPWLGGAAKTPSGLAQRNKESGCLLPRPAPLLAPGSVTAAGVKIQGGRTESQLSGPQGRGKRTLAQTSWRPQGGQSSPRDSLPRSSCPPWQVLGQAERCSGLKAPGEERKSASPLSALVPRGLAFGGPLVSQKLQHLHGLELAFLLTLRLSLFLELCSKEQRYSAREGGEQLGEGGAGWSSGQCH